MSFTNAIILILGSLEGNAMKKLVCVQYSQHLQNSIILFTCNIPYKRLLTHYLFVTSISVNLKGVAGSSLSVLTET